MLRLQLEIYDTAGAIRDQLLALIAAVRAQSE
jgi:hypothetical protein